MKMSANDIYDKMQFEKTIYNMGKISFWLFCCNYRINEWVIF